MLTEIDGVDPSKINERGNRLYDLGKFHFILGDFEEAQRYLE